MLVTRRTPIIFWQQTMHVSLTKKKKVVAKLPFQRSVYVCVDQIFRFRVRLIKLKYLLHSSFLKEVIKSSLCFTLLILSWLLSFL